MSKPELMLLALVVKHFICDYPLQASPYMYRNKGTYGHPGGILHAGIHFAGTAVVCWFFSPLVWAPAFADFVIHYHVDWAKMRIGAKTGWGPTNSEQFWILLGFDQLLHYLTYFLIVWWVLP